MEMDMSFDRRPESAENKKPVLVNEMQIVFEAKSENEGFARTAAAAFIAPLNPTMDELADGKTAVS